MCIPVHSLLFALSLTHTQHTHTHTHTAQAVESYDDEKRARLLQFVTGSSRVPLEGFKALQGQLLTPHIRNLQYPLPSPPLPREHILQIGTQMQTVKLITLLYMHYQALQSDDPVPFLAGTTFTEEALICPYYMAGSTGAIGPRLFTIHLVDMLSTDSLPKAHTW